MLGGVLEFVVRVLFVRSFSLVDFGYLSDMRGLDSYGSYRVL